MYDDYIYIRYDATTKYWNHVFKNIDTALRPSTTLKHKCSFLGFSTNGHSYIKFRAEQSEIQVLL
jgi:hypothetical protein